LTVEDIAIIVYILEIPTAEENTSRREQLRANSLFKVHFEKGFAKG
jgi:hypothetical protein